MVLSGGGAKGVFESGAVHAFFQVGLEPHVITGSSVGAVNALALAEVVRARRIEGHERARETMEDALALWQRLDKHKIANLDRWGWRVYFFAALALGMAVLLGSWAWLGAALADESGWIQRGLAAAGALVFLLLAWRTLATWHRLPGWMRARLHRGMSSSLDRSGAEAGGAGDAFDALGGRHTGRWLRWLGLHPAIFRSRRLRRALERIVPADRRLSDYRECGLDVRLTRTNVRTGRTEHSEHFTARQAAQAGIDRGRRVLGDPLVVPAALASAAFPVAYAPVDVAELYPASDNPELFARLSDRATAKEELSRIYGPRTKREYLWFMALLDEIAEEDPSYFVVGSEPRLAERIKQSFDGEHAQWSRLPWRSLFALVETRHWPQLPLPGESSYGDRYFDGGILDNTPLGSALAAIREADARRREEAAGEGSESETEEPPPHEAFVVLLSPRPRRRYLSAAEAGALAGPALGIRALRLQAEKRLAEDARMAEKIDRLLARRSARTKPRREAVPALAGGAAARSAPAAKAEENEGDPAETWPQILARERGVSADGPELAERERADRMVRVEVTRVHPEWDLPWVLALDDRLGFRAAEARRYQVRGCRDTLMALHVNTVRREREDRPASPHVRVARKLLGIGWHDAPRPGWVCRVDRCTLKSTCDELAAAESRAERAAAAVTR